MYLFKRKDVLLPGKTYLEFVCSACFVELKLYRLNVFLFHSHIYICKAV